MRFSCSTSNAVTAAPSGPMIRNAKGLVVPVASVVLVGVRV